MPPRMPSVRALQGEPQGLILASVSPLGTLAGVDIDTLTMEQYLALSQENLAPGMVKSEIEGNVNFEIKTAKRWVDRLAPGTINTCDLLKKAFIQRYYPPSMTAKQLEDIPELQSKNDMLDAKFAKDLTSTKIVPLTRKLNKWKRSDMENLDEQRHLTEVMEENFV
ncbi:hypothetical protein Tco_1042287 [Tanacetum coccineum]|uniref:Uncharacterized protein n=1 Tax=Tanacetum coccineum TaxID=301880 RepID=A0ABQ5GKX9_9ASTR